MCEYNVDEIDTRYEYCIIDVRLIVIAGRSNRPRSHMTHFDDIPESQRAESEAKKGKQDLKFFDEFFCLILYL
jgi:hypothetical protein